MHQAMRMLESPSVVIRAKAFLVILTIITGNNDSLLIACQNRLVLVPQGGTVYMKNCLQV